MPLFTNPEEEEQNKSPELSEALNGFINYGKSVQQKKTDRLSYAVDFDTQSTDPIQRAVKDVSLSPFEGSVRYYTDYRMPGQFERSVSTPGRVVKEFISGFGAGAADLIELPELLVNAVGKQFGMDEDDKFRFLHNISNSIKETVDDNGSPEGILNKVAYYAGYMIPDMIGIMASGGLGVAVGKAAIRSAPSIAIRKDMLLKAARITGVIGFGTVRGGLHDGYEGAQSGAAQFTLMEAAGALFGHLGKPAQVLANAVFMVSLTAAMTDPDDEDFADEVIAAGILGGGFGLLSAKNKARTSDADLGKTKGWTVKQRLQGKKTGLNEYMMEFLKTETEGLHKIYDRDPQIDMKRKMREKYNGLNEGKIADTNDAVFANQLRDMFLEEGGVTLQQAGGFAQGLMKVADVLDRPEAYKNDQIIGDYIKAHGDKIWVAKEFELSSFEQSPIDNTVRYTSPFGVEYNITPAKAKALQEWEINQSRNEISSKRLIQKNLIEDSSIKGRLEKAYKLLVEPAGKQLSMLEKSSKYGYETARTLDYLGYGARGWTNSFVTDTWNRIGLNKLSGQETKWLNELLYAGRYVDEGIRDALKGLEKDKPMTRIQAEAVQERVFKEIRSGGGDKAVTAMEEMIGNLYGVRKQLIEMSRNHHLITDKTAEAYLFDKHLGKMPRFIKSMSHAEVARKLEMNKDKVYTETLSASAMEKYRKQYQGESMIEDSLFLLEHEIRSRYYLAAKNDAIRSWHKAAVKTDNAFAKSVEWEYYHKNDPFKRALTGKELEAVNQKLTKHEAAQANRKLRREEKKAAAEAAGIDTSPKPRSIFSKDPIKDLEKTRGRINDLIKEVEKKQKAEERFEDHVKGDFDTYDVGKIKKNIDKSNIKPSEELVKLMEIEKALKEHSEFLTDEIKKPDVGRRVKPVEGYVEVKFLEKGKSESVMIAEEAAHLLTLGTPFNPKAQGVLRALGHITLATPVRFLATTLNPVFAMRALPRDLIHFSTANTRDPTTPVGYMKDFALNGGGIIKDVFSKGKRFKAYTDAGGREYTRSTISVEDSLLRHSSEYFQVKKTKTQKAWENFTQIVSKPNDVAEVSVRVFAFERLMQKGLSAHDAAFEVNKMLNFSRKGNLMRTIDSMIPFANVATQALDAQARAFRDNPVRYGKKIAVHWGLRMSMAVAAYAYAPEAMDDVSARMKIGNYIIPLGLGIKNKEGDMEYAYYTVPVEKNPIAGILDTALFGMIDIFRGKGGEREWKDIYKVYAESFDFREYAVAGLGPDIFPPAVSAYQAMYNNKDPRTHNSIWKGNVAVNLADRYYQDTPQIAINISKGLEDYTPMEAPAPVGIQRAAQSLSGGNMFMGFMGWLLHDVTYEERENMSRKMVEMVPGLKNLVKWTKSDTSRLRLMMEEDASERQREVSFVVRGLSEDIKSKAISKQQAIRSISSNLDWDSLTKKEALININKSIKGWDVYQKISKINPDSLDEIPSYKEWEMAGFSSAKTRARWWIRNEPLKGTPAYKAFNALRPVFLGQSNQLFYHFRNEKKNQ